MSSSIDEQTLSLLKSLLPSTSIITPSSPLYPELTSTWAVQKNLHPRLVLQPADVNTLSKIIAYLSSTSLDFAVRGSGYGSASSKDVLISMTGFDEFQWDPELQVVTLGAGLTWRQYYEKMEVATPEYQGTFPNSVLLLLIPGSSGIFSGCYQ
jgi:FAD/FMN-containing dehydrogenase